MTLIHRLSIHSALQGFGLGLFLAVQGLFLIEKGIPVWQMGLIFGTYGLTAALLELPLGASADLHGRIRVFRWSRLADIVGMSLAIFSHSLPSLLVAMVIMGLGRALHTGTIDAWQVEQFNRQGDSDKLASYLARLQSISILAIGIGALCGGYLPQVVESLSWQLAIIRYPTEWNLLLTVGLAAVHLAASYWLFSEADTVVTRDASHGLRAQIKQAVVFGWQQLTIRHLLYTGIALGLVMSICESYWQAQLRQISADGQYALFGWMAFGYFVAGAIGPMVYGQFHQRWSGTAEQHITGILLVSSLLFIGLALQTSVFGFALFYLGFFAILMMINVPAELVLNNNCTDAVRSSMHSVMSLALQTGGAGAAFGLSMLVRALGISATWIGVAVGIIVFSLLRDFARRSVLQQKPAQQDT